MKAKKTLSLILSIFMILALFSACGGGGGSSTSAPETTAPAASDTPATEAPEENPDEGELNSLPLTDELVEFELFTGMMPPAMDYIESMEECYVYQQLEERTGIHMLITQIHPSAQADKFNLMVNTGDYADFINSVGTLYSGGLPAAIEQDVVLDLTELVEEFVPNYSELINSDSAILRDVTLDDGSIGAFYSVFAAEEYADSGPMVRGDWLEALELENPQTYDQYYEVLKAFKSEYDATMWVPATGVANNIMYGFDMMGGYTVGMRNEITSYYVVDGVVKCGWLEDGFKEYIETMNKWYAEGLIDPDYITGDIGSSTVNNQPDALSGLMTGKFGFWNDDITAMDVYKLTDENFGAKAAYHATQNEGDVVHVGYYTSRINGPSFSISTECDDPELAARYINYLYSEEGSLLCNWGTEDYTYTENADGSRTFTELITNNPEGMPYHVAQFVYLMDSAPFVLDRDRMRTTFDDSQMECYDVWQSNYDREWTLSTQLSLNVEESAEYAVLMGDLLTYISENLNKFIVGQLSLEDDYETFIDTLKDLGIDECVGFYQNAYDRWNSK